MDFLTNPFIIALLFLYQLLGGSLVLAIIVFTVLTRVITFPLTQQQLKSSKKMQQLSPKLQAIREKYKGDREKQSQAQMELYREHGINPFAGCLPLLIQMPILFGLYGAIYGALGNTPMQFLDLSHRLLIPNLSTMLPLQNQFLWMNLGQPDPTFILPALVVATTWLQSKLMMPPTTDPKDPSAATARTMTTIMPIMIGLFSLSFASGLSIYWVVGNLMGIAQSVLMGQADFRRLFSRNTATAPAVVSPASSGPATAPSRVERAERADKASERGDRSERGDATPAMKKTKGLPPPKPISELRQNPTTAKGSTSSGSTKPASSTSTVSAANATGIDRKVKPGTPKTVKPSSQRKK